MAAVCSRKWIKLIKDPHIADQYTALLGVQSAHNYDEGSFTCQVEDFNIQHCLSKQVKVGRRPLVRVEPMSLTVRKVNIKKSKKKRFCQPIIKLYTNNQ